MRSGCPALTPPRRQLPGAALVNRRHPLAPAPARFARGSAGTAVANEPGVRPPPSLAAAIAITVLALGGRAIAAESPANNRPAEPGVVLGQIAVGVTAAVGTGYLALALGP